jgi:Tfp pilus assembly ATPase PilU
MLNSPLISDLIFKGDVSGIKDIMKKSRELGMQTFDQSLFDLYEAGPHQLRGRAAQRRFAATTCASRSSCTARKRRTATSSRASATWTSSPTNSRRTT